MTASEIVGAFCDLEPAEIWAAFRELASDESQPEERRVRAAAWLAIANAAASLEGGRDEEPD